VAIGTAVIGGVITSTFLVTIFAPLFYVVVQTTLGKKKPAAAVNAETNTLSSH